MRQRTISILFVLITASTATSCGNQKPEVAQPPSIIQWNDLQITPPAENSLCWDISIAGNTPKWEDFKRNFQYGLAMGMSATDISGAREAGYQTYWVEPNQAVTAIFHLWYPKQNVEPAIVRFFVLLDEKQLPDVFPSEQYYKDVIIPVGSETTLTLNLPPLTIGLHDLVIIGIPYVDNYPTPEGVVKVLSHRSTLIAGLLRASFRQISFSALPAEGLIPKGDPRIFLSLTLAEDTITAWNWPEKWLDSEPDIPIKFFILAGHEDVTNLDAPHLNELESSFFSLLLFADYKQIALAPSQAVIYGEVNKNTAYARVPAEFTSLSPGKHQVLVLRISFPGVPMCVLQGPPGERILPSGIMGILVGINVLSN